MEKIFGSLKSRLRSLVANKQLFRYIATIVLVLSIVIILSFVISTAFIGGTDFYVKWKSTQLLMQEEKDPYSLRTFVTLSEEAEEVTYLPLEEASSFVNPIYGLFIFIPLSYIDNFEIARGLWLAISFTMLLFSIKYEKGDIFDWKKSPMKKIVFILFVIANIFTLTTQFTGYSLVVSLFLIMQAYRFMENGHYELAGIMCGLASIHPGLSLFCFLIFFLISIRERQLGTLIWFLITVGLSVFAGYLLQDNWIPNYLQANILGIRSILGQFELSVDQIGKIVGIAIPILILIVEWLRCARLLHQDHFRKWLFNLSLAAFAFAFSFISPAFLILILPAWAQTVDEWTKRESKVAQAIGYTHFLIYIALTLIYLILEPGVIVGEDVFPTTLITLSGLHLLINMYWIRGWINQDYMKNYIQTR